MKYTQAGNCPRCGAPIFSFTELRIVETSDERNVVRDRIRAKSPRILTATVDELVTQVPHETLVALFAVDDEPTPVAHYTCECRAALPTGFPDAPQDPEDTTERADRKTLARRRTINEPASDRKRGAD